MTDHKLLIITLIQRRGGKSTASQIVRDSDGVLSLGGIYGRLNRLERDGIIASEYSVSVLDNGHRVPVRTVRLLSTIHIPAGDGPNATPAINLTILPI